jgi:hypothetical protein
LHVINVKQYNLHGKCKKKITFIALGLVASPTFVKICIRTMDFSKILFIQITPENLSSIGKVIGCARRKRKSLNKLNFRSNTLR